MSEVEKYANEIRDLVQYVEGFQDRVRDCCGGSFKWGVEQVMESYLSLFDRFCPFKVGDRVVLRSTLNLSEGHGWYGSRNSLVKGAAATVRNRGYHDGQFTFDISLDNESWVDDKGVTRPVSSKHVYRFPESSLLKFEASERQE